MGVMSGAAWCGDRGRRATALIGIGRADGAMLPQATISRVALRKGDIAEFIRNALQM
jgi:hypothetical protein